ncbi:MAG: hypothetical protein ABSC01_12130 [Verrucomicrobiota bacterium]|jgi:hypothetical protein
MRDITSERFALEKTSAMDTNCTNSHRFVSLATRHLPLACRGDEIVFGLAEAFHFCCNDSVPEAPGIFARPMKFEDALKWMLNTPPPPGLKRVDYRKRTKI